MASLRCLLRVHDCCRWRLSMMRESPEAVKRSATIARNPRSRRGHGKARRQVRAGDGSEPRHRRRDRAALRRGGRARGVRRAHPARGRASPRGTAGDGGGGNPRAGGNGEAVTGNNAEAAECERLVARAREIYGPVDVLVNNAALTYYVQVKDYPINKWMRSWA